MVTDVRDASCQKGTNTKSLSHFLHQLKRQALKSLENALGSESSVKKSNNAIIDAKENIRNVITSNCKRK